jgi:hypothetical protein
MKKIKEILVSLGMVIAPLSSWANDGELPNREKQLLVQFQSTTEEERYLKTHKSQTIQKTITSALEGEPAAIHWVGLNYLTGANGFKQDEKRAYGYFSAAAGLGYAPSMDRLKTIYLNTDDPFMALVYVNLMIGQGHSEFKPLYEEYKKLKNLGPVFAEIEKIAERKRAKIAQNIEGYKGAEDKTKFIVAFMTSPGLVTEDKTLSDPKHLAALRPPLKESTKEIADAS